MECPAELALVEAGLVLIGGVLVVLAVGVEVLFVEVLLPVKVELILLAAIVTPAAAQDLTPQA